MAYKEIKVDRCDVLETHTKWRRCSFLRTCTVSVVYRITTLHTTVVGGILNPENLGQPRRSRQRDFVSND